MSKDRKSGKFLKCKSVHAVDHEDGSGSDSSDDEQLILARAAEPEQMMVTEHPDSESSEDEEPPPSVYETAVQQEEDTDGSSSESSSDGEGPGVPSELNETIEALVTAHWTAKNQTAERRKKRGFIPPPKAGNPQINLKGSYAGGKTDKSKAKCFDCNGVGHMQGDATCPNVIQGISPPYVPKEKQQKQKGKKTPKMNHMVHPVYVADIVHGNSALASDVIPVHTVGVPPNPRVTGQVMNAASSR